MSCSSKRKKDNKKLVDPTLQAYCPLVLDRPSPKDDNHVVGKHDIIIPSLGAYCKLLSKGSASTNKLKVVFFMKNIKVRTGQKAPVSGQYRAEGSSSEVTFVQGKRVPPTANGIYSIQFG